MGRSPVRLLDEQRIETDRDASMEKRSARPTRSLTVNITESPLGWLLAHGHVTRRQFDAGERLRCDWERAQLAPRVTMAWDAAPVTRGRGGSAGGARVHTPPPHAPRPLSHRPPRARAARAR